MTEFLASLGLFGWIVLVLAVLVLANLRGVLRAVNPRGQDRVSRTEIEMDEMGLASGRGAGDRYAAVGTRSLIDPADPAGPRG